MFKYCVVEIERRQSDLILPSTVAQEAATKPVWNILYKVEFDPSDEPEVELAFNACQAWVEQNKAPGSKYAILEMFFC